MTTLRILLFTLITGVMAVNGQRAGSLNIFILLTFFNKLHNIIIIALHYGKQVLCIENGAEQ